MPIGCSSVMPVHRLAERVVGGQPALVHRRGGQRREADHVADGVDVVDLGLELARRRRSARGCRSRGRRSPGRGVRSGPAGPPSTSTVSAGICLPLASVVTVPAAPTSTRGHLLAEAERHRQVAQVELQRLDDLRVAELQHVVALLDHRDLGAERGEHRGVLDADDAGADDHHRRRQRLQVEDAVGVQHPVFVELDAGRPGRLGAGGDHDVFAADGCAFAAGRVIDQHGVRVEEPAVPGEEVDPVAHQLRCAPRPAPCR